MKAFITGAGWVTSTSMGSGRNQDRFQMQPGRLPEITRKDVFERPFPHFGRLDRYSRLGISAIGFALKDAQLDRWARKRPIGIIASTVHGCLDTDTEYFKTMMTDDRRLASPHLFAYTLPNSFLGEASIFFGLTGNSFVINEPSASSLWCLRMALIGIADGQFEKVICGICDLGHQSLFPETEDVPCGALFFVIEDTPAQQRLVYGGIYIDHNGRLKFDDDEIKNMPMLAEKCLSAFSKKD